MFYHNLCFIPLFLLFIVYLSLPPREDNANLRPTMQSTIYSYFFFIILLFHTFIQSDFLALHTFLEWHWSASFAPRECPRMYMPTICRTIQSGLFVSHLSREACTAPDSRS